jgi:hypothetical protein
VTGGGSGNAMRVETTGQARGNGPFLGTGTHAQQSFRYTSSVPGFQVRTLRESEEKNGPSFQKQTRKGEAPSVVKLRVFHPPWTAGQKPHPETSRDAAPKGVFRN